jgi:hypothetical protein
MKKILLSTIVMIAFSLSIILFQISCKTTVEAQSSSNNLTQQNILLFTKESLYGSKPYIIEIWTSNYDGGSQKKVPISLSMGLSLSGDAKLSPDAKIVFFNVNEDNTNKSYIYSCQLDGSNLKRIIDNPTNMRLTQVDGAY